MRLIGVKQLQCTHIWAPDQGSPHKWRNHAKSEYTSPEDVHKVSIGEYAVREFHVEMSGGLIHLKFTLPLWVTQGISSKLGVWISHGVAQCGSVCIGIMVIGI